MKLTFEIFLLLALCAACQNSNPTSSSTAPTTTSAATSPKASTSGKSVFTAPVVSKPSEPPPEKAVQTRIADREFPSIFQAWNAVDNVGSLSPIQKMARHDLVFVGPEALGLKWNNSFVGCATGFTAESLEIAKTKRAELIKINPNIVLLSELSYRDAPSSFLPEGNCILSDGRKPSTYSFWRRDFQGKKMAGWVEGGYFLLDFTNTDYNQLLLSRAKAIVQSKVFDGVMLDWWDDNDVARISLVKSVRAVIGSQALILVNSNDRRVENSKNYVNGLFMEMYTTHPTSGALPDQLPVWSKAVDTLQWAEKSLREPRINCLEFWFRNSRDDLYIMKAVTAILECAPLVGQLFTKSSEQADQLG
jgi:hypothetical protein